MQSPVGANAADIHSSNCGFVSCPGKAKAKLSGIGDIAMNNNNNSSNNSGSSPRHRDASVTVINFTLSPDNEQHDKEQLPAVDVVDSPNTGTTTSSGLGPLSAKRKQRGCWSATKAWMLRVGPSCCSHPDIQKHSKVILVAFFFCIFGIALCSTGVLVIVLQPEATFSILFIVGGLIIFLPGIYYVVYVIRAYLGHDGYSFDNLPSMD